MYSWTGRERIKPMNAPAPPLLYQHLADDVASMIASGTLRPGDKLPSLREMRTRRQVSVCFYGIAADSSHFAVSGTDRPCFALNGNAGWLCRHADTWQTHDGGEAMNRNTYPYRWTDTDQPLALWQAVEQISTSHHLNTTTPSQHHNT